MSLPSMSEMYLPVLNKLAEAESSTSELVNGLADLFKVNSKDRATPNQSGESKFENRARWTLHYLKKAGLITNPVRGKYRISQLGRQLLDNKQSASANLFRINQLVKNSGDTSNDEDQLDELPVPQNETQNGENEEVETLGFDNDQSNLSNERKGILPAVSRQRVLDMMAEFDQNWRNNSSWLGWEQERAHTYAIRENNRNYPVKRIVAMATGVDTEAFGSSIARRYLENLDFTIVELRNDEPAQPPLDTVEKEKKMALPLQLTRNQVLAAMKTFDDEVRPERPQTGLNSWQNLYSYFVKYEGKLYPAKRLAEMAAETELSNTDTARRYLQTAGFQIVKIPYGTNLIDEEEVWPELDGPAFVVIHKYEMTGQTLGQSYIFGRQASGDVERLGATVRAQGAGGAPVYLIVYRPGPEYSLAGWARVSRVSGDFESQYKLDLDYHSFPEPLDLKGNAAHLLRQIEWLKGGLKPAFNYRSIREISQADFNLIIETAKGQVELSVADAVFNLLAANNGLLTQDELIRRLREQGDYPDGMSQLDFANKLRADGRFMHPDNTKWMIRPPQPVFLPVAWPGLAEYWNFVQLLDEPNYTAQTLRARAEEYGEGLNAEVDELELATNLCQLRLLRLNQAIGNNEPTYSVQDYANGEQSNVNETAILRLMALGLLLPIEESADRYELLARRTVPRLRPLIEQGAPFSSGLAPELKNDEDKLTGWYAEAGLLTYQDGQYHLIETALATLDGTDSATTAYNKFLQALLDGLEGKSDLEPISGNPPLKPLTTDQLTARLDELKQDLIIDEMVVRRIYRSLIAGRHVVLSGPPGTGKTELARRLSELFWSEKRQVNLVTTDLSAPPSEPITLKRNGYKPMLVTATEDWGVSDVIGGIRPRLSGDNQTLSYAIHYGHLTRAILKNYDGLDRLDTLPEELPTLQRSEYKDKNGRYSGVWLVIDEFNRAPIDAAFGSLLTTLSGSTEAHLAVPTGAGGELPVQVPKDFRIIGTLNSFDRHFLNQMSEALKRRFDFIDVLPPTPAQADEEQRLARRKALTDLQSVYASLWRIFMAIRLFRQFGTAQAEATYLNLFSGVLAANLEWPPALDYALADTLADQLQVLNRDEQRILLAYLRLGHDTAAFVSEFRENILGKMPQNRRPALLSRLAEAYALRFPTEAAQTAFPTDEKKLNTEQIERLFDTGNPFNLPPVEHSVFYQRLNSLANEQGL